MSRVCWVCNIFVFAGCYTRLGDIMSSARHIPLITCGRPTEKSGVSVSNLKINLSASKILTVSIASNFHTFFSTDILQEWLQLL